MYSKFFRDSVSQFKNFLTKHKPMSLLLFCFILNSKCFTFALELLQYMFTQICDDKKSHILTKNSLILRTYRRILKITIYKCNFNIHVSITGSNLICTPLWLWRTFFKFAGAYFQYRLRKQVIWGLYSAVYVSGL